MCSAKGIPDVARKKGEEDCCLGVTCPIFCAKWIVV
jgi:hypothetical protein